MIERDLKIVNKLGLHARAASLLVKETEKYHSNIDFEKDGVRVNGKSIMGILMLAAPFGSRIRLYVNGSDEVQCADAIEQLVNNKFDEEL